MMMIFISYPKGRQNIGALEPCLYLFFPKGLFLAFCL